MLHGELQSWAVPLYVEVAARTTLAPIILPGLFEQLLVVFQCLDKLALVAAYGEDIRMAVAAPGIDEIAVIAREVSRVRTSRISNVCRNTVEAASQRVQILISTVALSMK